MKTLILAYVLLSGADATTTGLALHYGGREVLLPTQNPVLIDGMIAGQAASVAVMLTRLHTHHPKLALAVGTAAVAVRGLIVAHNAQQLERQ